jgi:ribosomal-protein-alanine N-acetyltransferase
MVAVRQFRPGDIHQVMALARDSLQEDYPPSLFADISNAWPGGFLVAEGPGQVVGFVAAVKTAPMRARILMLAVRPELRLQGIATGLMQSFINECGLNGHRIIELEVRTSNLPAITFYQKLGFQVLRTVPRFYRDGEDAYKMARTL